MTDTMTREQRHRCMAAIKGKDTKPEMTVRKYLFSKGLRFRVQVKNLPGRPDIVLPRYKTVIFVDGCFWHGHEGCRYFKMPKSNVDFWQAKIDRNVSRDARNIAKLKAMGWRVIRVWECEIKTLADREATLSRLYSTIVSPLPVPLYPSILPSAATTGPNQEGLPTAIPATQNEDNPSTAAPAIPHEGNLPTTAPVNPYEEDIPATVPVNPYEEDLPATAAEPLTPYGEQYSL